MNEAEKRNALMGNMRDYVVSVVNHEVFRFINIPNDRFAWDDLVAHVVCLELASGPTDVKAKSLRQMYEAQKKFDTQGTVAKQVRKVLNYIKKGLSKVPAPEFDVKWGFVDMYLLITTLMRDYVMSGLEEECIRFYVKFERLRRKYNRNTYKELASGDI